MARQSGGLRLAVAAVTGAALVAVTAHFEKDLDRREAQATSPTVEQLQQTGQQQPVAAQRARRSRGS